jgi:uncharacterized metal-binding protein
VQSLIRLFLNVVIFSVLTIAIIFVVSKFGEFVFSFTHFGLPSNTTAAEIKPFFAGIAFIILFIAYKLTPRIRHRIFNQ